MSTYTRVQEVVLYDQYLLLSVVVLCPYSKVMDGCEHVERSCCGGQEGLCMCLPTDSGERGQGCVILSGLQHRN